MGRRPLDASVEHDGKHVRPLQQTATFAGGKITLDVDHNLIHTGDTVTATLRAYSDTPMPVNVELEVYYTPDQWGARTAPPAKAIDKEHFTLAAAPDGGKPVQTRIRLDGDGQIDTYRIFVHERDHGDVSVFDEDPKADVAAVGVLGWAGNDFDLEIHAPKKLVAGEPFKVTVRATNTTTERMRHAPYIHLGTAVGLSGIDDRPEFTIQEDDSDDHRERYEKGFAPGETAVERFIVTPTHDDVSDVTFVASAFIWPEEGPAPIAAGAMDAKTVRFVVEHKVAAR
jgi:hypothetical protein